MSDKRYVVGLQDQKDLSCFKDIFETDKVSEAIAKADEKATTERAAIVFKRPDGIIHRAGGTIQEAQKERPQPQNKFKHKKKSS